MVGNENVNENGNGNRMRMMNFLLSSRQFSIYHFNEQHPARVGSLPSGAATRAFFYKTVFSYKKTVLVKSSARQTSNSLELIRGNEIH